MSIPVRLARDCREEMHKNIYSRGYSNWEHAFEVRENVRIALYNKAILQLCDEQVDTTSIYCGTMYRPRRWHI